MPGGVRRALYHHLENRLGPAELEVVPGLED
jgi:hypothetical protein